MSISHLPLLRGSDLERASQPQGSSPTQLHQLAQAGRVVQFSGDLSGAQTSCAAALLSQLQRRGETSAWITPTHSGVYAPDLHAHGVDLEALLFIRLPDASLPYGACRAAELLLHSGAFGILILDFSAGTPPPHEQAWLSRLAGAARQHQTLVLLLTARAPTRSMASRQTTAHSLGPLVFLHATSSRRRNGDSGGFEVHHEIHKYKASGHPSLSPTRWRGPWGLR